MSVRIVAIASATILVAVAAASATAAYPDKPVHMVVPFTPAGATDLLARSIGERLSVRLGQSIVIENRPGAGGNVGAEIAARAAPDGYTLIMAPASVYAISVTLYSRLNYDLVRDFTPVSLVANVPHVLIVNPSLPVQSAGDLIAYAKARPGQLNIASQGSGTVSHLEAELFKHMAQVDMVHVPYRGSAPAVLDLIGGRTQVMFDSIASALPHIRSGKLRALAVTSMQRSKLLPELPTVSETGLTGYSAESWLGILVPAGTPQPIVERLNKDIVWAVNDPKTRARLMQAGYEPASSTPEAFATRIREEIAKWAPVVKRSGATPD